MDLEADLDSLATTASPTAPAQAVEETPTGTAPAGSGLIAAAGPTGLRLLRPDGGTAAQVAEGLIVNQPTWARDGSRLAATVIDPGSGTARVAIVDVAAGDVVTADARRPYFFYSWNHDGTRLAALGPGSSGGTALDILDASGTPTSTSPLQSGSIYVAWEPGGQRLLIHAGPQLLMVRDPDSPSDREDLGVVGFDFQAAAWVPGTQDFLYVDSVGQSSDGSSVEAPPEETASDAAPRLVRRGADSGAIVDLGPAEGYVAMAVHPLGDRAALSFVALPTPASADPAGSVESTSLSQADDVPTSAPPGPQEWSGSVQIVDLATGERLTALPRPGFWLEWSPDGRNLLIATAGRADTGDLSLAWHVWDGEESFELARFRPSVAFARSYLPFADQYNETPRLWSPDSEAIVFGAIADSLGVTAVARLDSRGGMTSLGLADISFWSPAPVSFPYTEPG